MTHEPNSRRQGPVPFDSARFGHFPEHRPSAPAQFPTYQTDGRHYQPDGRYYQPSGRYYRPQGPPSLHQHQHNLWPHPYVQGRGSPQSFEPPQISTYRLAPTPGPAWISADANAHDSTYRHPTENSWQPRRTNSMPLKDISENEFHTGSDSSMEYTSSRVSLTTVHPSLRRRPPRRHSSRNRARLDSVYTRRRGRSRHLRRRPNLPRVHLKRNNGHKRATQTRSEPNLIDLSQEELVGDPQVTSDAFTPAAATTLLSSNHMADYKVPVPPTLRNHTPPGVSLDPSAEGTKADIGPGSVELSMQFNKDQDIMAWMSSPNIAKGLMPPVSQRRTRSPSIVQRRDHESTISQGHDKVPKYAASNPDTGSYQVSRPTCSLNLVCYRSGAKGCDSQQLQCVLQSKFQTMEAFQRAIDANKNLVRTDQQFFKEMRRLFDGNMTSSIRRWFSLKSHKAFRILVFTPTKRPIAVPFADFVLQEMMFAYLHPDKVESADDWIQWVFKLRCKDKRHAVEFVEGWDSTRIAIAGSVPWLSSCIVGIAWTAAGGDVQSAFTVASFILTSSSIVLALLAILSSIESSGRNER